MHDAAIVIGCVPFIESEKRFSLKDSSDLRFWKERKIHKGIYHHDNKRAKRTEHAGRQAFCSLYDEKGLSEDDELISRFGNVVFPTGPLITCAAFPNIYQRNDWISNPENRDLDQISRIRSFAGFEGFEIQFRISPNEQKNHFRINNLDLDSIQGTHPICNRYCSGL